MTEGTHRLCLVCGAGYDTLGDRRACWTCAPTVPASRWVSAAHEAGRLAAIRADVEHFIGVIDTMSPHYTPEPFSKRRRRDLARLHAQAADCRRWLEATR